MTALSFTHIVSVRASLALGVSLGAHALLAGLGTLVPAVPMDRQTRVRPVEVRKVEQRTQYLRAAEPARVPVPAHSLGSLAKPRVRRPQVHLAATIPRAQHASDLAPQNPTTNVGEVSMAMAAPPLPQENVTKTAPAAASFPAAASSSSAARVVAVPRYRSNPAPEYPIAAKRRREEGEVRLSVTVSRDGRPLRVSLLRSSGHALLDQAAIDAVLHWTFEPAMVAGVPVEDRVVVPVRFSLSRP